MSRPICPYCKKKAKPVRDRQRMSGELIVVMYWCENCKIEVDKHG